MWSCAGKIPLFISGLTVCVTEWDRQNKSVDGVIRKGCTRKGRISTHGEHTHTDPHRSERQEPQRSVGMHTVPLSATMCTSRIGMHAGAWLFVAIVICSAGATSLSPTIQRSVSPLTCKIGEDDASAPFLRGRLHKQTTPFSVLEDCSTSQSSPVQSPTPIDCELQLPADRESIKQALFKSLELTARERERIATLEQGSQEWLDARMNRLTASNFGAAAGHNKWTTPAQLVHEMLYGTFKGNEATRWGSAHEHVACEEYELAIKARAGAQHGDVKGEGVLEIKCPYRKRLYDGIPPQYSDQLQGLMGVLGATWADFCVWTPSEMSVQRVDFEKSYWEGDLLLALKRFYFDLYVPAYVEKEMRRMAGDDSTPPKPM